MTIQVLMKKLYFLIKERKYKKRLRYIFERNNSHTLAIVFSGFSEKPVYNYMRTLQSFKIDKLFLLDDFAYRGSYYWYSNGDNFPESLVTEFMGKIISGGGYKLVITMGTSKGGSSAVYYGLKLGVTKVYAGACQYRIGDYLTRPKHLPVFKSMMGENAGDAEVFALNNKIKLLIENSNNKDTEIHLLYSESEESFSDMKDMICDLSKQGIKISERIDRFEKHDDVSNCFIPFVQSEFNLIEKLKYD